MTMRNFVAPVLILAAALIANVYAQAPTKPVVQLPALVGKSSAEIEAILGKPKQAGAVAGNKLHLPITTEKVPDYFQLYKISNVNLGIWFYQDKPILFQSGFRDKMKVGLGNKTYRLTLEEAMASIGIDIKNSKPNEVRFEAPPAPQTFSPRTVIKIWNGEINGEKWGRVEAWESEHDSKQIGKERQLVTSILGVWIVPLIK